LISTDTSHLDQKNTRFLRDAKLCLPQGKLQEGQLFGPTRLRLPVIL